MPPISKKRENRKLVPGLFSLRPTPDQAKSRKQARMAEETNCPLFIVGCSRSGTTLLRLILTHHSKLHIPAESEFLLSLHENADTYGTFEEAYQRWFFIRDLQTTEVSMGAYAFSIFNLGIKKAEQVLETASPTTFAGASAALFEASAKKQGKPRWGDKTPHYVRHVDWLAESFPTAKFLHMIRDGRDVARSRVEAGFTKNIRASARHWKKEVLTGRESGTQLPDHRYRELFFEDLVDRPRSVLQNLCDWVGLDYEENMLHYHQDSDHSIPDKHAHLHEKVSDPIDSSRAQAWKKSLSQREIGDIEDVAGDLLRDLGYECTDARVPRWLRCLRQLHRKTVPLMKTIVERLNRLGIG